MTTQPAVADTLSELSSAEAHELVGKTVAGVEASEYGLVLTFEDGSTLEVRGSSYGDCALGVEYTHGLPTQNE